MADMMKMLANLTIQNQQLLQQHLQQNAAAAGDRGVQQQTAGAADNRGLQQQMAAGDGGRVQEPSGARDGRVIDCRDPLVRETSIKQESLSGERRQASLAGSYPGFRVAGQAPAEDVPRRDGQREESGTVRGFGPARESAAMFEFGQGGFKPTIPVFTGKQESFSKWKQEAVIYSRRHGFDAVFARANECQDVNVGDPDCPMERLQDEFMVDTDISRLSAWQFLSALKSEKDRNIIFRVNSPGAAWSSLFDTYSLKAQRALLALLQKLDSRRIGTNDDPTLKVLEMEDIARSLRSSHSQWQHLTESHVIGKFVSALLREYDIQKQMLEEREDGFSREAVVSSVQKRFDSFAYKQLRRSKPKSGEDQAFAVTGGGKNHSGRGGSRHGSRKPGGSQGGRGNGSLGGKGSSDEEASSGSSSAATAKPGRRTWWVCKSDQHYVRDCPKQICQGCGERGHYITTCAQMENLVMAVDILGRTSKNDDSDVEA